VEFDIQATNLKLTNKSINILKSRVAKLSAALYTTTTARDKAIQENNDISKEFKTLECQHKTFVNHARNTTVAFAECWMELRATSNKLKNTEIWWRASTQDKKELRDKHQVIEAEHNKCQELMTKKAKAAHEKCNDSWQAYHNSQLAKTNNELDQKASLIKDLQAQNSTLTERNEIESYKFAMGISGLEEQLKQANWGASLSLEISADNAILNLEIEQLKAQMDILYGV
jgi:hypothetical protein